MIRGLYCLLEIVPLQSSGSVFLNHREKEENYYRQHRHRCSYWSQCLAQRHKAVLKIRSRTHLATLLQSCNGTSENSKLAHFIHFTVFPIKRFGPASKTKPAHWQPLRVNHRLPVKLICSIRPNNHILAYNTNLPVGV